MFTHERSETNTIMLTVLRMGGTVPVFPTDYNIPQLRISHVNGGTEVEDLAYTDMNQMVGSNRWFYKYSIDPSAVYTKYLVYFKTTIEGVETITTEEFKVVPKYGEISGGGEFVIEIIVKHSISHAIIQNATIRIFDKSNPSIVIATTQTDSLGKGTIYLDAGNYLAEFTKTGVISEIHDLVVYADGSYNVIGD